MTYEIARELFHETYAEIEPLYRQHYSEMERRLVDQGIPMSPYNPRLPEYYRASEGGWLLTYIVRLEGAPVGYANCYITHDMHNQDLIAQEDTIFILRAHRNGIGKKLLQVLMMELKDRGVKRLNVPAMTDLRVARLWERMGFKHAASSMSFTF